MRLSACTLPGIILAAGAACSQAAAQPVDPNSFIAGWPLELSSEADFFAIPVSAQMYQAGRRPEEWAVLDADNQPLPFVLLPAPGVAVAEMRATRPASPLFPRAADEVPAGVSVSVTGDSTNLLVTRTPDAAVAQSPEAFLVDARDLEFIPTSAVLQWRAMDQPFLLQVSVRSSEHLSRWQPAGGGGVAALSLDDTLITHASLPIRAARGSYFLFTPASPIEGWLLERVDFVGAGMQEQAAYEAVAAAPMDYSGEDADPNSLYFDLGGALPVVTANLAIAGNRPWAIAELSAADSLEGPWRPVAAQRVFYAIERDGERLESTPARISMRAARFWRARFANGLPPGEVSLALHYAMESLRVAANGNPPYQLVAGTLLENMGPDSTFAAVMAALESPPQSPAAGVGPMVELGGAAAVRVQVAWPWRLAALWFALAAAAAGVCWMAVRLWREHFAHSPAADAGQQE